MCPAGMVGTRDHRVKRLHCLAAGLTRNGQMVHLRPSNQPDLASFEGMRAVTHDIICAPPVLLVTGAPVAVDVAPGGVNTRLSSRKSPWQIAGLRKGV